MELLVVYPRRPCIGGEGSVDPGAVLQPIGHALGGALILRMTKMQGDRARGQLAIGTRGRLVVFHHEVVPTGKGSPSLAFAPTEFTTVTHLLGVGPLHVLEKHCPVGVVLRQRNTPSLIASAASATVIPRRRRSALPTGYSWCGLLLQDDTLFDSPLAAARGGSRHLSIGRRPRASSMHRHAREGPLINARRAVGHRWPPTRSR